MESLTTGEANMKSFVLERPERPARIYFDLHREFGEKEWEGVRRKIEDTKRLDPKALMVSRMRILFPEDTDFRKLLLPHEEAAAIAGAMKEDLDDTCNCYNQFLWALPRLIPDSQEQLECFRMKWETYRLTRDHYARQRSWPSLISFSAKGWCLKTKYLEESPLTPATLHDIRQHVESFKENDIREFAVNAATMKLWTQNTSAEIRMTEKDWSALHDELQSTRERERWDQFTELALNMAILAAKEIRFDFEKGLQLIPHVQSPQLISMHPLPDLRKFASQLPL